MKFIKIDIQKPLTYISGGQFVADDVWTHTKRNIDSLEIIIGVNDILYIQQNDINYEVHPGDVLLIMPNQVHQGFKVCSKGVSFYWFHFYCHHDFEMINHDEMEMEVSQMKTNPNTDRSNPTLYFPVFSTPSSIERINILFHQLLHVGNSNYYTNYCAHYLLTSLLLELSEQSVTDFYLSKQRDKGDINMAKMLEWIRIHVLEDISLHSISKKFNYNKDYLSRTFKQKTGRNLMEHIHLLKISKAKDMLARTTYCIKEISSAVGIQDEKYFMKLFKKYEKITTSEFRKAYYETHMNNS
ncbi:helix-turn-helix domain-containing protein [Paenibacillus alkaliterrae]|uniref:helix-turn-helix domain-containing protein n=1 Tax=Paenibacillus alkaliterrae TaxID=320909 RepID=UPI001F2EFC6C|nr:helix-turn-helix domain-containing protein [Paenibacillus alkaliterrae]MCF2938554.1 helix-turn-helix domain-containing protein [Paenibacillus alkaliterrae]